MRVAQPCASTPSPEIDDDQPEQAVDESLPAIYEVIEAYWSPLDKNKTTAASVASWLLTTIFRPINTTAYYLPGVLKWPSDIAFILGFAVLGAIAFGFSILEVAYALADLAKQPDLLAKPSWSAPITGEFRHF